MTEDRLSVVIVDYRAGDALRRCVASVLGRLDVTTDVTIVDNSGTGDSRRALGPLLNDVRLIESTANVGFARAVNRGLSFATADWVGLVNPDVEVPPGALGLLVEFLRSHPRHAAVGPVLRRRSGVAQAFSFGGDPDLLYVGRRALARLFRRSLHAWNGGPSRDVDWVSGACLVARRETLTKVGPLDEEFFLYFEDVDWCLRCRQAGWRIGFVPAASVWHDRHDNRGDESRRPLYRKSMTTFYRKHYGLVAQLVLEALFRFSEGARGPRMSLPASQDDVSLE